MSWAEVENDSTEMEENPYPEEDSDLPHRQHQDGGELGFQGEEDGPEEDLAMAQEIVDITDSRVYPTDEADIQLVQNVDNTVNVAVSGCDNENDSRNLALSISNTQFSEMEASAVHPPNRMDVGVQDGDSFEQDEATAAPECENNVRHDACSESDRQLFEEDVANDNVQVTAHFENNICDLQELEHPDPEYNPQVAVTDSNLVEGIANSDINSSQAVESMCKFTGDVEIANSLDDAPEAEVSEFKQDGKSYLYEEEDNLNLFLVQETLENSQHVESLPDLNERPEETNNDLSVRNTVTISRNGSNDLAILEGLDQQLQAPECDREAVSYPQMFGDGQQQIHITPITESVISSVQAQLGDPQVTTAYNCAEDERLASNNSVLPASALEPTDHQLNLSPAKSFKIDTIDTQACCTSEVLPRTSEVAQTGQGHIGNAQFSEDQPYSGSSPEDDFSTQSIDSGTRHHPIVPISVDHQHHEQQSQAVSSQDKPNSLQHSGQKAYSIHNAVSVNPVDINEVKNNLDANSSQQTSLIYLQNVRDPSSSGLNLNGHLQLSDSSSQNSTAGQSEQSSPDKPNLQTVTMQSNHFERELALALQSDDEDELLHELDAELLAHVSRNKSPRRSYRHHLSGLSEEGNRRQAVNGLQQSFDFEHIQQHNRQLLEQLRIRDEEIEQLTSERDSAKEALTQAHSQVDEQQKIQSRNTDDLYLPQITTLENTVAQQQNEIKTLKEKLVSHDSAAKRAVITLQHELKSRVDQITKMYEECLKEKDMMVIKFAESEAKNMEAKRMTEKMEAKMKEAIKDKEVMANTVKAAKLDKQKAVSNFDTKNAEVGNLQKELEKLKEAINSSEYRIKWFQNKLKDELENHKETKSSLEKTTVKLKEAREETEIIRKECHSIVKRYQESEDIKSNSLDKELKLKETELRTHLQERNDTEEIHQMTKRELESLKSQHKDTAEKVKTYHDKIVCLEEERRQNHSMIENHQEIMQRQKAESVDLKARIAFLSTLEEDYKRAQEMIQTLDKDIAELKVINRDIQKDTESCKERESRMLALQSELSGSNAVLRSENTNLSNKASMLTGEVEKLKMEIQELETTVKDLSDKYDEEKTKRKEEAEKFSTGLAERIKECNEMKQKWEDEIDSNKTLKRRHTNNVKDLTRQLQQVRKRLDAMEGKGDAGSMGSRTNSNGSLNSIENSSQHSTAVHQPPMQEFPVITEQVEVDKQVLIERIVRLQKSHARKNEKLEFLGEHIQQLLDEIRNKNKIIQCYALREESGTLSSEDMDANKTLLARKGGIMASVYTVHQQDGRMTLELSLQINQKLQAVLEDTLLKNITLKESLDTLGAEIARLSQENRRLQFKLQEIEGRLT